MHPAGLPPANSPFEAEDDNNFTTDAETGDHAFMNDNPILRPVEMVKDGQETTSMFLHGNRLPLLQLLCPRDEFRDDVINGLHLLLDPRFETVAVTNTVVGRRQTFALSDCLVVKILIEPAEHLDRCENFGKIWLFHRWETFSDVNATGAFLSDCLPMSRRLQWQPSRVFNFLRLHWMRPRVAKTESSRKFFGSDLRGCFNNRSQWIAHHLRVLRVGVVDAPKLILRLLRRVLRRVHAAIEHDAASRQVRIAHFVAASGRRVEINPSASHRSRELRHRQCSSPRR